MIPIESLSRQQAFASSKSMCIANEKEEKSINASGVVRDYKKTITLSFSIFFVRKMMDREKE